MAPTDLGDVIADGVGAAVHQPPDHRGTLHDPVGDSTGLSGLCGVRDTRRRR